MNLFSVNRKRFWTNANGCDYPENGFCRMNLFSVNRKRFLDLRKWMQLSLKCFSRDWDYFRWTKNVFRDYRKLIQSLKVFQETEFVFCERKKRSGYKRWIPSPWKRIPGRWIYFQLTEKVLWIRPPGNVFLDRKLIVTLETFLVELVMCDLRRRPPHHPQAVALQPVCIVGSCTSLKERPRTKVSLEAPASQRKQRSDESGCLWVYRCCRWVHYPCLLFCRRYNPTNETLEEHLLADCSSVGSWGLSMKCTHMLKYSLGQVRFCSG